MDLMKALVDDIAQREGKDANDIWEEMTNLLR